MEKVIVFDVWGQFGHFRKHYTTTSSSTFSFPPRTAIIGMIGAILGIEKHDINVLKVMMDSWEVGVIILSEVKKIRETINYISTSSRGGRTQIVLEILKEPKFRIFVKGHGALFDRLTESLQKHETVYTPYLGISEFIAAFLYVGAYVEEPGENIVHSVVRGDTTDVSLEDGATYVTERAVRKMGANRAPLEYATYVFRKDAHPVSIKEGRCVKVGGHPIIFL
ncbi:MAG TPA: type I-B CRISPR-associated protein Cas5b [Methanolinea sp.]|nr:type I-B CRISPR-associated protein Cas5b [Methanolinea sp.]HQK56080.1 type I-B CRISPR-associated protein Cas5b [Methanolinea sp.]